MAAPRLNTRSGFKPDHKSFGAFMLSSQALEPVREAAADVAKLAREMEDARDSATSISEKTTRKAREGASRYAANFQTREGPVTVVSGNPRRIMHVFNDKPYAAVREFGRAPGHTGAGRSLRRAGAVIGELRGEIG